ncbi:hypothetical protein [Paenibacillus beijingensis]|uniref:Uncharacterized protein n=1 Tax=Paenibacillus beijingensis TaxID=1126833 RepID=A0A0D5NNW3_9BACL|nr:hypothetical protein [Paenibacillus beijingensis]AJY76961.1 hypothetical protein VN24_23385 [Paenibacillus beijingensis]
MNRWDIGKHAFLKYYETILEVDQAVSGLDILAQYLHVLLHCNADFCIACDVHELILGRYVVSWSKELMEGGFGHLNTS